MKTVSRRIRKLELSAGFTVTSGEQDITVVFVCPRRGVTRSLVFKLSGPSGRIRRTELAVDTLR